MEKKNIEFGRLLAEKRKEAGMTQQQIAAASGMTQAWVSIFERGRHTASVSSLLKYIAALPPGMGITIVSGPGGVEVQALSSH